MKRYAIIVAGGSGSRFGSAVPKQFLILNGKPVLARTLEKFYKADASISIHLVLPATEISRWKELCIEYTISIPHKIIEGGNSRFQSVRNGLHSISDLHGLVAIHDGVRPLVTSEIINTSFNVASEKGSAIAAVSSKDSVRIISEEKSQALDRSKLRIIQTPQTFQLSLILKAFEQEERSDFTDDASVAEAAGFEISLIEGSYSNIKITTPEDLILAECLLNNDN
jgi:2-C-methyl-D-erythritol 4-phosphate cytidylyltransferase